MLRIVFPFLLLVFFRTAYANETKAKGIFLESCILPEEIVKFDVEKGKSLTLSTKTLTARITVTGRLGAGWKMQVDDKSVNPAEDRSFEFDLSLNYTRSGETTWTFQSENGGFAILSFSYYWKEVPNPLRIVIAEEGKEIAKKSIEIENSFPTEQFVSFQWETQQWHVPRKQTHLWAAWQINTLFALPDAGGISSSLQISWAPYVTTLDPFHVRGLVGLSLLKYEKSNTFLNLELGILGSYHYSPLQFGLGPGLQAWFGQDGLRPLIISQVAFELPHPWVGIFELVFWGYSLHFGKDTNTHLLKLGLLAQF